MTALVVTLIVFVGIGATALAANLVVGWLVRPNNPTVEKGESYECGEEPVGSAWVQFDLRFYVVALLFVIFDVEIAFFFPWAMVYGGAMQLADHRLESAARTQISERMLNVPAGSLLPDQVISAETAHLLGVTGLFDILVFFGVLLVGFAYVWKRGDLDWVRAMAQEAQQRREAAIKT